MHICIVEADFRTPQIKDPEFSSAIKLFKTLHSKIKTRPIVDKTITLDLSNIKDNDFLNTKIERLAKKQIYDPMQIVSASNSQWMKALCVNCPFMLTQRTRMMLFRTCFFDRQRSIHFLMQYLKSTSPVLNNPLFNLAKMQRLKLKVNRKAILDCGIKAMNSHGNTHSLLEFDFFEENGSGMGPTLEFYSLSAAAIRELDILWRPSEKATLFPAPINPENLEAGIKGVNTSKICQLFKYMGWLCARAISDDRLADLPFADVFWELVLGKKATIIDLRKVDQRNGAFFFELDRLRSRKVAIQQNKSLNEEQKRKQIETLTIGVSSRTLFL
jgi:E3 ubiquitin-protein ligase TRIP12